MTTSKVIKTRWELICDKTHFIHVHKFKYSFNSQIWNTLSSLVPITYSFQLIMKVSQVWPTCILQVHELYRAITRKITICIIHIVFLICIQELSLYQIINKLLLMTIQFSQPSIYENHSNIQLLMVFCTAFCVLHANQVGIQVIRVLTTKVLHSEITVALTSSYNNHQTVPLRSRCRM